MKTHLAALALFMALPAAAQGSPSNWKVNVHSDMITDQTEVHAVNENGQQRLAVMCTRGRPNMTVMVETVEYLGGGVSRYELRDTYLRFDESPATMESWKYVGNYATPYDQRMAKQFLQALVRSDTFRIRLMTFKKESVDLEFPITGANAAIADTLGKCGLSL